jgi:hypothetical protein
MAATERPGVLAMHAEAAGSVPHGTAGSQQELSKSANVTDRGTRCPPSLVATEQPDLGVPINPAPDCHQRAERRLGARSPELLDHSV